MKGFLTTILAGVMVLSLTACTEGNYSSDADKSSDFLGDIFNEPDELTSDSNDALSEVSDLIDKFLDSEDDKPDESASNESANIPFTIAGVEFSIPNYYNQISESISGDTSINDFEVIENGAILVRLRIAGEDLNVSQNDFDNVKDTISSNIAGNNEISNSNDITLAGLSGRFFTFTTSNENTANLVAHVTFAYNITEKKMICVLIIASSDLIDKYINDYNKIIETAKLITNDMEGQAGDETAEEQFDDDLQEILDMDNMGYDVVGIASKYTRNSHHYYFFDFDKCIMTKMDISYNNRKSTIRGISISTESIQGTLDDECYTTFYSGNQEQHMYYSYGERDGKEVIIKYDVKHDACDWLNITELNRAVELLKSAVSAAPPETAIEWLTPTE